MSATDDDDVIGPIVDAIYEFIVQAEGTFSIASMAECVAARTGVRDLPLAAYFDIMEKLRAAPMEVSPGVGRHVRRGRPQGRGKEVYWVEPVELQA